MTDKLESKLESKLKSLAKYIQENCQYEITALPIKNDNLIIYVEAYNIITFLNFLKTDQNLSFKILLDVFGADFLGKKTKRFEVIYNLLSLKNNCRLTIKVALDCDNSIPTASTIFSSAGWFEREVFDMYGIVFENHPDLRRILTDYGFEGHPLRKDFPLTGYKEVRYDETLKKVIYEPVKLMQEFRNFDFESPWDGMEYKSQLPGDEKVNNNS